MCTHALLGLRSTVCGQRPRLGAFGPPPGAHRKPDAPQTHRPPLFGLPVSAHPGPTGGGRSGEGGGGGGDRSGGVFLFGLPPGTPLTTRPDSRVSVSIEGDLTFRRLRLFLNFFCHFNQNPERKIIKEKFNEIQVKLK